jgi:hypothetical protein
LKLLDLTARIFDLVVHLEAFRTAHEPAAEDEEAPLEAAGVLHGSLGAIVHAACVLNLLVDAGQRLAPAAALSAGELLLQLHAADLVVAVLGERVACHAGGGSAAQRKNGKTTVAAADAAHRRSVRKLVTGVQVLAFPNE